MGCSSPLHVKSPQAIITHQETLKSLTTEASNPNPVRQIFNRNDICRNKDMNVKMRYLQQNKQFVELRIQTNICVDKVLQTLAANEIMHETEMKKLISKNKKSLEKQQVRYRNLQIREERAEQNIKKISKSQRYSENQDIFKKKFSEKINKFREQFRTNCYVSNCFLEESY